MDFFRCPGNLRLKPHIGTSDFSQRLGSLSILFSNLFLRKEKLWSFNNLACGELNELGDIFSSEEVQVEIKIRMILSGWPI